MILDAQQVDPPLHASIEGTAKARAPSNEHSQGNGRRMARGCFSEEGLRSTGAKSAMFRHGDAQGAHSYCFPIANMALTQLCYVMFVSFLPFEYGSMSIVVHLGAMGHALGAHSDVTKAPGPGSARFSQAPNLQARLILCDVGPALLGGIQRATSTQASTSNLKVTYIVTLKYL